MAICTEREIQQNVLSFRSHPTISGTGTFTQVCKNNFISDTFLYKNSLLVINLFPPLVSWQTEYRNKCEFLISAGANGEDKTIGFRLGKYKGGSCAVVGPADTCHVSAEAKRVVCDFQKFIRY